MIKVFLVEDEIVVREGIKKNIDWAGAGLEFCGEASDGELAYPMIQKLKPDIVITDIKMPFMNGLELSRLVKEEMPWIKIMILSGYDEFEFAQKAISIGVTDYLIKPIVSAKLLASVKQVAAGIEEERRQQQDMDAFKQELMEYQHLERQKFFSELILKRLSVTEILERGKKLELELSGGAYCVLLFKAYTDRDGRNEYSEALVSVENEVQEQTGALGGVIMFDRLSEGWAFLIKGAERADVEAAGEALTKTLLGIMAGHPELEYFGGQGEPVGRLSELYRSFEQADKAFAHRYVIDKSAVIKSSELNTAGEADVSFDVADAGKLDRRYIENFIRAGAASEAGHFIDEYFQSFGQSCAKSQMFRQYIAMDMYFCTMSFMETLGCDQETAARKCGGMKELGDATASYKKTTEYLIRMLEAAIGARDAATSKKCNALVENAKTFIQQSYMRDDLSLNTVAASVNMSPSYFCTVFSQEEGKTFVEYLTAVRMEKAKELLRGTSRRSSEIAYDVGYKDPHYFSYTFKKTQGMTPREYRTARDE